MNRKGYFWLFRMIAAIIAIIVTFFLAIGLVVGLLLKSDYKGERIDSFRNVADSAQAAFGISFPDDAELVCGYSSGWRDAIFTVVFECPIDDKIINEATISTEKADEYIYKLLGTDSKHLSKSYTIELIQDKTNGYDAYYEERSLPTERFDRVMKSLAVRYSSFSTLEYKLRDGKLVFRMWIARM